MKDIIFVSEEYKTAKDELSLLVKGLFKMVHEVELVKCANCKGGCGLNPMTCDKVIKQ